ncbi:MAG: glycosyltransferase 87 family protein [Actinomycetota bacterium]|nr:glycosyltransferase 87 family protein [Actinomycetota bacterium]
MVAGWAQFRARRYAWAGVLLSLGVWAKFFPIILLFYCVMSLLRDPRRRAQALKMVLWAGVAALVVNAPFAVANVGNWDHFFVFNARRGGGGGIL